MIAGVDEAGRGALIGPLVVAIFLIDDPSKLDALNLKDSKQLTPKKRSYLYRKLKALGSFEVVKLSPSQIDAHNINKLELSVVKRLALKHRPDKLYIDCFTKDCSSIAIDNIEVIAEYKADEKYPVVSAASIIAKVVRDAEIRKLAKRFGYFGSGYPSDERTVEFVREHLDELVKAGVVRRKWDTYKQIKAEREEKNQASLNDFIS